MKKDDIQLLSAKWKPQPANDNPTQWQAAYEAYLQSPSWLEWRRRVFKRASGICEGCRCRTATQVHHLRYPTGCRPGSAEWLRKEKLFDLVAICERCHEDISLARSASAKDDTK